MPKVGEVVRFEYNSKARHGRIEQIELQPKTGLPWLTLCCSDGRQGKYKRFSIGEIKRIEVVGG